MVIDAAGLKVFGEGEWNQRKYGQEQRRVWRKLHLAVDAQTHEAIVAEVSLENIGDSEVFTALLSPLRRCIGQVSADGAYAIKACNRLPKKKGARQPYRRAKRRGSGRKGIHETTPWRH